MSLKPALVQRLFWPEKPSLFVIIGGAVGMAGDMASFFTGAIGLPILAAIFGALAAVCMLLCLQRASLLKTDNPDEVKAVVDCRTCDAMRFGVFATLAFLALLLLGQGKTVTESVGEQLGLIRADVAHISQQVDEIGDIAQSQKLVKNPSSAEDYFRNAWIHTNIHRDAAQAFESMTAFYDKYGPNKLDAADLYYNAGRQVIGRDELLKRMEDLGAARKDASLLVIAARNAVTPDETARLQSLAQSMAPDYPFAWWDIMTSPAQVSRTPGDPGAYLRSLEAQAASLEKFITLLGAKPASAYFYLPQYQPDYEVTARQTLSGLQPNIQSLRQSVEQLEKVRGGAQ